MKKTARLIHPTPSVDLPASTKRAGPHYPFVSYILKAGARQIDLSVPVCMGVINVTPDSFSDGSQLRRDDSGRFRVDVDKALHRAESMAAEGAVFVDVGGESTRPGADAVAVEEELARVIPVIEAIHHRVDVCISVDTSSPAVMEAAIKAGAEMINDIRALTTPGSLDIIAAESVAVCLMHMQGQPDTMQKTYRYDDVVGDVKDFLTRRVDACTGAGVDQSRLLIDPGFGFGKSIQHNYQLLKNLDAFASLELPLLVGISRKSMIGAITERPVEQRLPGSIAASVLALAGGARVLRSHDVAATVDAIRVHCAYQNG